MCAEFKMAVGINTKSDKNLLHRYHGRSFGKEKSVFILTARDTGAPRTTKVQTYYKGVSAKSLYYETYETLDTEAGALNCVTVTKAFLIKKDIP